MSNDFRFYVYIALIAVSPLVGLAVFMLFEWLIGPSAMGVLAGILSAVAHGFGCFCLSTATIDGLGDGGPRP